MFVIDKEYALCPVGKPQFDMKYRVVDDDGNDVPDGEIGEFVFENPYVRGYINLPEETAKVFKDGFSISNQLWMFWLWAIPYGLGASGVDAILNNYVALHYKAQHMSWLHCMWGVGASISPYIMSMKKKMLRLMS